MASYLITLDDGYKFKVERATGDGRQDLIRFLNDGATEPHANGWIFYPARRIASVRFEKGD